MMNDNGLTKMALNVEVIPLRGSKWNSDVWRIGRNLSATYHIERPLEWYQQFPSNMVTEDGILKYPEFSWVDPIRNAVSIAIQEYIMDERLYVAANRAMRFCIQVTAFPLDSTGNVLGNLSSQEFVFDATIIEGSLEMIQTARCPGFQIRLTLDKSQPEHGLILYAKKENTNDGTD